MIDATDKEKSKTQAERAEDIAYTINHSLYCTLTDFINPPVNAATDGYLRWLIPGCGHDHSADHVKEHVHTPPAAVPPPATRKPDATAFTLLDRMSERPLSLGGMKPLPELTTGPPAPHIHHRGCSHTHHEPHVHHAGCGHTHHEPHTHHSPQVPHMCSHGHVHFPENMSRWDKFKFASKHAFSKERFIQYAKGEFIGDFASVPITIAAQRFAPGMMDGVRKLTEPFMRPIFNWGIERSSRRWAKKNGVEKDSVEYNQHKHDVYEHEMSHFPQAVVWTVSSLGLNVAYQMVEDKQAIPFWNKLALKSGSVLAGVGVTAGVVVAARALAPHKVREFDQWTSRTAILPTTRFIGRVTGMYDDEDVNNMVQKQGVVPHASWQERLSGHEQSSGRDFS